MNKEHRRNALGRGLDTLLSVSEVRTDGSSAISEIQIDRIDPNPEQPRTVFDEEALDELAASISELGIIQPCRPKGRSRKCPGLCPHCLRLRDHRDGPH